MRAVSLIAGLYGCVFLYVRQAISKLTMQNFVQGLESSVFVAVAEADIKILIF